MQKILKYVLIDILRNRILLTYTALLFVMSLGVLSLEGNSEKGILSLLNLTLIVLPLMSIIFATIYLYNAAEFIELLSSQPIKRKTIWLGLGLGLSLSLALAFMLGAGVPILLFQAGIVGVVFVLVGILLSFIFVGLGMVSVALTKDKARGVGVSILLWLFFAFLYDALLLFLLFQLSDYPLEKPILVLSACNPIDLSRILILLKLDISALMGYTGAVLKDFFGNTLGAAITWLVLSLWVFVPFRFSSQIFQKKDL